MANASIMFFFPFRHPSGVSNLFVRLSGWIANHSSFSVALIDFPDGHMARTMTDGSGVRLVPFSENTACVIPDDAILVTQSLIPYTLPRNLVIGPDTKIVQWHFLLAGLVNTILPLEPFRKFQFRHPGTYRMAMAVFLPGLRKALGAFINGMAESGALIFHDSRILSQTRDFIDIPHEAPTMLPVPVSIGSAPPPPSPLSSPLRCGWVGRLYDFKIHILLHTVSRLSDWASKNHEKIVFRVVGDGDESRRLADFSVEHEFFELKIVGSIRGDALEEYMKGNFDIAFSMGTSALESAAAGIPTMLLDYSTSPICRPYRYKWIFEATPGDIGHAISEADEEDGADSLFGALEQFKQDSRYIALRCYEYCKENHGMEAIASKFLEIFTLSNYRWKDVPPRLKKISLPRRLRSYLNTIRRP